VEYKYDGVKTHGIIKNALKKKELNFLVVSENRIIRVIRGGSVVSKAFLINMLSLWKSIPLFIIKNSRNKSDMEKIRPYIEPNLNIELAINIIETICKLLLNFNGTTIIIQIGIIQNNNCTL